MLERLRAARNAVRQTLGRSPPHVVSSHFAPYTFPALDLLRHYPLVVHFHGPWAYESQIEGDHTLAVLAKGMIERAVYRQARLFIVLSEAFASLLSSRYGVDDRRIRVVPGGVQMEHFDTGVSQMEARARLRWPTDRRIILSVRRLYQRMGLENLIHAFRAVRLEVPDAMLYIGGTGPLFQELRARIAAAELDRDVRLLGFVPESDLPLAYRAADLTVVPSVAFEGFGLVTVESLAAGTPVLVTPVGGLPEIVRGLSGDFVLPNSEAGSIADRLTAILQGRLKPPDEATCREDARARFDWNVVAQRTRHIYDEAVAS